MLFSRYWKTVNCWFIFASGCANYHLNIPCIPEKRIEKIITPKEIVLQKFIENIDQTGLFKPNDRILLAVSGGLDSVVMTHLFALAGYKFAIAHCNFRLRGEESDMDEAFVRELADRHGVDFFVKSFNTREYSRENGVSIQMAARQLRYQWFEEVRAGHNFSYLAAAHHTDDHTETVLINMIRGTGLQGLQGIRPKRDFVIRPLWIFTRNDIEVFALKNKLPFREDSSNAETRYIRNKIRHKVTPILREINPSFNDSVIKLSRIAEDAIELISFFTREHLKELVAIDGGRVSISLERLKRYPSKELILFELLKGYGFQPAVVENLARMLDAQPGKMFFSPTHVCLIDRENLLVTPLSEIDQGEVIEISKDDTRVVCSGGTFQLNIHHDFLLENLSGDSHEAFFDLSKLRFPLQLRHPVDGDFFFPIGMTGKKKISDFLTDKKIPRTEKSGIWLLCCGDAVMWVAGLRPDDRFKVKNTTRQVLMVKFEPFCE